MDLLFGEQMTEWLVVQRSLDDGEKNLGAVASNLIHSLRCPTNLSC